GLRERAQRHSPAIMQWEETLVATEQVPIGTEGNDERTDKISLTPAVAFLPCLLPRQVANEATEVAKDAERSARKDGNDTDSTTERHRRDANADCRGGDAIAVSMA